MSVLPPLVRKTSMEGEPDDEFPIEEMVILPGTELWHRYHTDSDGTMYSFMSQVESAAQGETFPFLMLSDNLSLAPPAPAVEMQSRIYERVLSCLELSSHPGNKAQVDRVLGDHNVNEKSHKLSYLAVHIISQLQVVANDNTYEESCQKFSKDKKKILILGIKNTTLVGLMVVLLQLKRTSSQLYNMRMQRMRSFVTADPLLPANIDIVVHVI